MPDERKNRFFTIQNRNNVIVAFKSDVLEGRGRDHEKHSLSRLFADLWIGLGIKIEEARKIRHHFKMLAHQNCLITF